MTTKGRTKPQVTVAGPAVLDRAHLAHYTMNNAELEREIIALFLQQLPNTVAMLKSASKLSDWKLATHTLKGSAAAVGATAINELAGELERCQSNVDVNVIQNLLVSLDKAVAQFRQAADRLLQ